MSEEKTILEVVNEIKAQAWNESMAPRLPALLSFLSSDEWTNGIQAWLLSTEKQLDNHLRFGCKSRDEDQFVRGQLKMLVEIIDLPRVVKHQLEKRKEHVSSRGVAGY